MQTKCYSGKTSQPIAKSFDKEVLVKVKLDFKP